MRHQIWVLGTYPWSSEVAVGILLNHLLSAGTISFTRSPRTKPVSSEVLTVNGLEWHVCGASGSEFSQNLLSLQTEAKRSSVIQENFELDSRNVWLLGYHIHP